MKKIVIDHLDFFAKTFTDIKKHHIKHRYSNEMAQKSHIVRSRSRFTMIILHMLMYYICNLNIDNSNYRFHLVS